MNLSNPALVLNAIRSTNNTDANVVLRLLEEFGRTSVLSSPRVVTMNKAHRTHYSDSPDPEIEYVLRDALVGREVDVEVLPVAGLAGPLLSWVDPHDVA